VENSWIVAPALWIFNRDFTNGFNRLCCKQGSCQLFGRALKLRSFSAKTAFFSVFRGFPAVVLARKIEQFQ
jgi:hypothetical protein